MTIFSMHDLTMQTIIVEQSPCLSRETNQSNPRDDTPLTRNISRSKEFYLEGKRDHRAQGLGEELRGRVKKGSDRAQGS